RGGIHRSRSLRWKTSYRGRDSSKAAAARVEILEGGVKIGSAKVRPQARSEMQFRVSNLPKRTVAQALLAPGADQEIDVGHGFCGRLRSRQQAGETFGRLVT